MSDRLVNRWESYPGSTVTDLLDWLHQRGLSPDEVRVTGGQLKWQSPETLEETARREEYERDRDARHEKWERETYEKLRAKFGPGRDPDGEAP